MILCGIDLETTGVDVEKDHILEVGMVLWDTEINAPVRMYSEYVYDEYDDFEIPEKATKITGITKNTIKTHGISKKAICSDIDMFFEVSDYVVTHNGTKFDMPMIRLFFNSCGKKLQKEPVHIDTIIDIDYPENCIYRSLIYLQAFHGFVMPIQHRAVFDVISMFLILQKYDISDIITSANSDSVWVEALVSYENRHLAKENKFRWVKPEGFNKEHWLKYVKTVRLHRENYDEFKVKIYEQDNYHE